MERNDVPLSTIKRIVYAAIVLISFLVCAQGIYLDMIVTGVCAVMLISHKSEVSWVDFKKIDDFRCGIAVFKSKNNR